MSLVQPDRKAIDVGGGQAVAHFCYVASQAIAHKGLIVATCGAIDGAASDSIGDIRIAYSIDELGFVHIDCTGFDVVSEEVKYTLAMSSF